MKHEVTSLATKKTLAESLKKIMEKNNGKKEFFKNHGQ